MIQTILLGCFVIASYIPLIMDRKNFDYWLGIKHTAPLYALMVLAAISFLVLAHHYGDTPLLTVFLVCSALWSVFTRLKIWWGSFFSLVVVAGCTMVLIARDAPPHVALASIGLGTVTILVDAVGWNARLFQNKYLP